MVIISINQRLDWAPFWPPAADNGTFSNEVALGYDFVIKYLGF